MAGREKTRKSADALRLHELHLMGIGALHSKPDEFDAWRIFGELKALKQKPPSPKWLEATIACLVTGRIRPTRAFGLLRQLRDQRTEADQMDKFAAFEGLVQQCLAPGGLTQHGYDQQTFAQIDHATVWEQVSHHLGALSDQGYRVFLNSGTLLGVVRDGKLIDHDDDIDLGIVLRARSSIGAAREWSELQERLIALDLFDPNDQETPEIYRLKPAGNTKIDLFPAWAEKGNFFVYPHTYGDLASSEVLPLRICERSGHPLPAKPEMMLNVNYGTGWKVPDPLFKFPWNAANARFAPFLEALRT